MRSSVRPPLVACVPLLLALFAAAGPVAEANAQNLGPENGRELPPADLKRVAVGSRAPNFTLASYGGGPVELAGYRGRKFVVLVFYRGHWWPFSVSQLGELRALLPDELRDQTEIVAVSPDDREGMERMVAKIFGEDGKPPEMVILSDPDHAVIDRYGIFNPNSSARHPFPHPTTYVIDKNGVVQYRFVAFDFRVAVTNEAILNVLKGL